MRLATKFISHFIEHPCIFLYMSLFLYKLLRVLQFKEKEEGVLGIIVFIFT